MDSVYLSRHAVYNLCMTIYPNFQHMLTIASKNVMVLWI